MLQKKFDLGPKNKSNVSCLSPYISHRLITEYEVAKIVLSEFYTRMLINLFRKFFGEFIGKGGWN